jgi:ferredoxin
VKLEPILAAEGGAAPAPAEKPKKAKLKRIAIKCEHCNGYDDKACISACPTGALLQINPADVFRGDSDLRARLAAANFDQTVAIDASFFEPRAFKEGLPDDATLRPARRQFWTLLGLFAVLTLGFLWEAVARSTPDLKQWTLAWALHPAHVGGDFMEANAALDAVRYRSAEGLGRGMGYGGLGLMFLAGLYPLARRRNWLTRLRLGSMTAMNLHIVAGIVGPAWIAIHSALRLDTWVSAAVWTMLLVVLSGLVGRWLYAQVPLAKGGTGADEKATREEAERLTLELGGIAGVDRKALGELLMPSAPPALREGANALVRAFARLRWLLVDDLRLWRRHRRERRRVLAGVTDVAVRARAERTLRRLATLQRRRTHLEAAQDALAHWKLLHLSATLLLTVLAAIHVGISWATTGL